MKQTVLILAFFPLISFCVAGISELRSHRTWTQKVLTLLPITLGIMAFVASFGPGTLSWITPELSVTISRVMTMACAVIACSGVFVPYSKKASAILVAFGGLALVFIWMFNRVLI